VRWCRAGGCGSCERDGHAPSGWLARRWNYDYVSKIFLDYVTNIEYILPSSLMEGRLLETILKAERGVASCGRGS